MKSWGRARSTDYFIYLRVSSAVSEFTCSLMANELM